MRISNLCFTGHRDISADDLPKITKVLTETAEEQIKDGITDFFSGGACGFDLLAEEAVIGLKSKYPFISLHIILPCRDYDKNWPLSLRRRQSSVLEKADEVIYLFDHYFKGCPLARDRRLVEESSVCVCYLKRDSGGTYFTVGEAKKQGLKIINIGEIV